MMRVLAWLGCGLVMCAAINAARADDVDALERVSVTAMDGLQTERGSWKVSPYAWAMSVEGEAAIKTTSFLPH